MDNYKKILISIIIAMMFPQPLKTQNVYNKILNEEKKDTIQGGLMVFGLATIAAIFFLILDQILRFLLNLVLTISF